MSKSFTFTLVGCMVSFLGAAFGTIVFMTYGGNFPVPFEFGNLPGYEGFGIFGGMLGAAAAGLAWVCAQISDPQLQKQLIVVYLSVWAVCFVLQHFVAAYILHNGALTFVFLPMIITGIEMWRRE